MKRIFHLPAVALGIVMVAVVASLAPATHGRAYAQAVVYYPYGQGIYGGYGQGYAAPYQAYGNVYQSQGGMFRNRAYGYSNYGYAPYGYRYDPYVRAYGRSSYYQPSYGPVYTPYGYRGY